MCPCRPSYRIGSGPCHRKSGMGHACFAGSCPEHRSEKEFPAIVLALPASLHSSFFLSFGGGNETRLDPVAHFFINRNRHTVPYLALVRPHAEFLAVFMSRESRLEILFNAKHF